MAWSDMTATTGTRVLRDGDFTVADLSLAGFGRKEISLAEHEMPGLMALREEYGDAQPLAGARIAGSLHMTVQTAVLIAVGPAGTPEAPSGVPVFAWKGETLEEYWWCTQRLFEFTDSNGEPI